MSVEHPDWVVEFFSQGEWIEVAIPDDIWANAHARYPTVVPPTPVNYEYGRVIGGQSSDERLWLRTMAASLVLARLTQDAYGWAYGPLRVRCVSDSHTVLLPSRDS